MQTLLIQALNGISFGALLFVLASGFTLVFGLLRVINLAHGAMYLVGGYVGVVVAVASGSFVLAIVVGAVTSAVLGLVAERLLLRRVRGHELLEVLVTVGIAFVLADLALAVFGGNPRSIRPPELLTGSLSVGPITYPVFRSFVIVLAIAVGLILHGVQHHSRVGAIIRAGVDDRDMAAAMGINIGRVFTGMFILGGAMAGLAGVVGAGMLTLHPGADTDVLLFALVVVIIGGLGSVKGAALGSLIVGLVDAFAKIYLPEFSYFAVFAPMALILILRPSGLVRSTT